MSKVQVRLRTRNRVKSHVGLIVADWATCAGWCVSSEVLHAGLEGLLEASSSAPPPTWLDPWAARKKREGVPEPDGFKYSTRLVASSMASLIVLVITMIRSMVSFLHVFVDSMLLVP